ncbi:TetR/AcrR family transcriptional regulator [Glaciecola siphonariae]|uniref:TetR/AcrR family transcriptional regulator n=1 Tax=Glaciecola siphonariae TaxID=521012 RepID=A0ABV9LXT9_9ALTE
MIDTKIKKSRGRPSKFDRNDVIVKACQLFREKGFEATSIAQLCEATKLKPPSLYASFSDKETLFCEVLETYHAPYARILNDIFSQPISTLDALTQLLLMNKSMHCCGQMNGCLIANSSIQVDNADSNISRLIKALHDKNEAMITARIEQGKEAGDVASSVNSAAVARFINGTVQGSAVLARGQQSSEAVSDMLETAMQLLPALLKSA